MKARKSTVFFGFISIVASVFLFFCVHAVISSYERQDERSERAAFVKSLGLTDLCLFTDARYTRSPSMADLATPFQDHPASMEHFPSGSIISPPSKVTRVLD